MTQDAGGKSTRVMLVDDQAERAERVERELVAAGYEVVARLPSANGLLYQLEQHQPDVVLIDLQSPGRDVLESLSVVNTHNPRPVVMFSAEDDPAFIQEAVGAGVSGYVMEGIQSDRVKPVIDLAIAQFRNYQSLREELANAQQRLSTHSVVDRAKQLLMRQRNISEDQAHRALRKLSMDSNLSLPEAARSVLRLFGDEAEENG